eukprot:1666931-Pyramimonas_sp.AAC.1
MCIGKDRATWHGGCLLMGGGGAVWRRVGSIDASRNPTSPSRNDAQRKRLDQGSGQHAVEGSPSGGLL